MFYRIQAAHRDVNELLAQDATSMSYVNYTERSGVSVMGSIEELAAYVAQGLLPMDPHNSVLVELNGDWADEEDEDAEFGALLVHPTKIISVKPLDDEFFALVDAHFEG